MSTQKCLLRLHLLVDYDKQKRILSKEEWTALNDLRNNNSIIKGNGVVIINRLDYLNKMKQLISGDDSRSCHAIQQSHERLASFPIFDISSGMV